MKLIIIGLILIFLILPFAHAITTNELKVVLKEVLKLYFENPQNSRLNVPELRDLLISFFETPTGQDVNLDKIGRHSGELLQEIYDKAKIEEWTIMVFMNGDNNLEGFGIKNINDMEQVGSSNNVNMIIQFDRSSEFDDTNGDWSTTKRFYIVKDNDTEQINSKELADLGEVDMSSPEALENFVLYTMENYPAEHYALILWNHGGGWRGILNDNADNPSGMGINELAAALNNIKNEKNMKFDIIGFDMCLMAMAEVYSQISEFAQIGIGSEGLEPGDGWNYKGVLEFINKNPNSDAREFASQITKAYYDYYSDVDGTITLSAINLSKINDVTNAISKVISKIKPELNLTWREISRANNKVERYENDLFEHKATHIDIFDFFGLIIPSVSGTNLYDDLVEAQNIVDKAVISNVKGAGHAYSSGISLYLPRADDEYELSYDDDAAHFNSATGWNTLIQDYYKVRKESDKEPPYIKVDSYEEFPDGILLSVNLSDDDILSLSFAVSAFNNETFTTWLDTPLGLDFTGFEEGQVYYFWDFTINSLYNGNETTFANIQPTDRTGRLFSADGNYYIASINESFPATLYFYNGWATSAYISMPSGEDYISSPVEIFPDDIFTPSLTGYDYQTNESFAYDGDPITIGDGLSIEYVLLGESDQQYFLSFTAEDLSGNKNFDGITFRR